MCHWNERSSGRAWFITNTIDQSAFALLTESRNKWFDVYESILWCLRREFGSKLELQETSTFGCYDCFREVELQVTLWRHLRFCSSVTPHYFCSLMVGLPLFEPLSMQTFYPSYYTTHDVSSEHELLSCLTDIWGKLSLREMSKR